MFNLPYFTKRKWANNLFVIAVDPLVNLESAETIIPWPDNLAKQSYKMACYINKSILYKITSMSIFISSFCHLF